MIRIVLMYHDLYRVSPSESGFQGKNAFQYKIQVDEFEKHVITVVNYCRQHPEVEVIFTFDDGGVSFLTLAAPVLEKYDLRGIFFITTQYLNVPLFLTTDQLNELVIRGHFIGSHSHTHPVLTDLNSDIIAEEWNTSVRILQNFMPDQVIASIPNGYGNKQVMRRAVEAGIELLYTSVPTITTIAFEGMQVIGRYVIYQGMTADDVLAIVAQRRRRRWMYIRWQLLRVVKYLLGNQYNKLKYILSRR